MGNSLNCVKKDIEFEEIEQQEDELTNFTKYPDLAPELCHHILTYCNGSTLSNYSQCSELPNCHIQMFNTEPPRSIEIKKESDGIVVEFCYVKGSERLEGPCFVDPPDIRERFVKKKFMHSDSEIMMKEIEKYLLKYYKYTGQKSTKCLRVNVMQWPAGLLKISQMVKIEEWEVIIESASMFDDFMENFQTCDHHITHLTMRLSKERGKRGRFFAGRVRECSEVYDQVIICSLFFKSEAFRNLQKFVCFLRCQINSVDFFNMEKEAVYLIAPISFNDIGAKVVKWNNTSHVESSHITIDLPEYDDRRLDFFALFPVSQFADVPVDMRFGKKMRVGKVVVELGENMYRRSLSLTFEKDED